MNIIDWILVGSAGLAVILIIFLIAKKWKKMLLLDVHAMPKAHIRSQKKRLIDERLQRKATHAKQAARKVVFPFVEKVGGSFDRFYGKLVALERKYRHASPQPKNDADKEKMRQKVSALLAEGAQVFKEEKFGEAEHAFLDVVRLDPQNVEAYEYLGKLYLQKKEYDHAIETLEFAKQLDPTADRIFCDLGAVYEACGNQEKQYECVKQCVTLAPNNPKHLDALLTVALERKDVIIAKETLKKLQEANPENQKITELAKQVAEL